MAAVVRDVRRIALDDDETRHVETAEGGNVPLPAFNVPAPLFSHEITFVARNIGL